MNCLNSYIFFFYWLKSQDSAHGNRSAPLLHCFRLTRRYSLKWHSQMETLPDKILPIYLYLQKALPRLYFEVYTKGCLHNSRNRKNGVTKTLERMTASMMIPDCRRHSHCTNTIERFKCCKIFLFKFNLSSCMINIF